MSQSIKGMNKPTNTDVCYGNGTVDIKTPVMALDTFTKTWCIDTAVKDDLSFRCKDCEFFTNEHKCLIKIFKCNKLPQYKGFGSMGDL